MIEQKAARGNIFWFRLYGKLTEEDYKNNLMPELERALEQYKKIRLLVQVEYFGGWTQEGAWEEMKRWPQMSKVERIAIVADDSWDEWMTIDGEDYWFHHGPVGPVLQSRKDRGSLGLA